MQGYFAVERAISRSAVADPGEGPGCVGDLPTPPPTLFLDQTEAQRAKKKIDPLPRPLQ